MKFVVVTEVGDEGAAEVAKEALTDRGIDVELRRRGLHNPYFPSTTAAVFEVRVPEEKVKAAEAVLAYLSEELEQAVLAQAGAAAEIAEEEEPPPAPPRREKLQVSWWFLAMVVAGVLFIALYVYLEGR
jgi:hypothetical protein